MVSSRMLVARGMLGRGCSPPLPLPCSEGVMTCREPLEDSWFVPFDWSLVPVSMGNWVAGGWRDLDVLPLQWGVMMYRKLLDNVFLSYFVDLLPSALAVRGDCGISLDLLGCLGLGFRERWPFLYKCNSVVLCVSESCRLLFLFNWVSFHFLYRCIFDRN